MPDNDRLRRFIIENTNVRGEIVHLNDTWSAILERADYPDNVRCILGEALAACALLAATIKFKGALILQIRGDGPLHLLVVQATSNGNMRGIARWKGDVPQHNLKSIFGDGQMVITIEQPKGEPYQGIIDLEGEQISSAIEVYFEQSEQLKTRLWLCADKNSCAGFLLQQMPGKETDDKDAWQKAISLATTITDNELIQLSVKDMLHRLFHEDDVRLFEPQTLRFQCTCSRERICSILISLGAEEARSILEEHGKISVDCEFCNAHYEFNKVDTDALFASSSQPLIPDTKH